MLLTSCNKLRFAGLALALMLSACVTKPNMHHAAFIGDLDEVKEAVGLGENVNARDPNGWTPIYSAVSEGHKEVVVFLLKHGASIDIADNNGWTVVDEAEFQGREEITTLLQSEQDRRETRYRGSIEHFGTLIMSNTKAPVYSEWFEKYPLETRNYWDDPFRSINTYVKETEIKYLASADYHGSRYGFADTEVQPVQGRFESDLSYQIRLEQIEFEQGERRKKLAEARRLMIADALQWVMGGFYLKNPYYNRSRAVMEFDLLSNRANFRQRIGAALNDSKLAKSIFYNPDKVGMFVVFRVQEKSYQLYGIEIHHQGKVLNAAPIDNAIYNLSI